MLIFHQRAPRIKHFLGSLSRPKTPAMNDFAVPAHKSSPPAFAPSPPKKKKNHKRFVEWHKDAKQNTHSSLYQQCSIPDILPQFIMAVIADVIIIHALAAKKQQQHNNSPDSRGQQLYTCVPLCRTERCDNTSYKHPTSGSQHLTL